MFMARIHRLVLLFLISLVSALPANAAPILLTLEKSVAIALQNATTVLKSENDLDFSGERVLQSYAQFLPTLDLTASYAYDWGKTYVAYSLPTIVKSRDLHAQYQITTSLNLFNGFFDYASFKSARQKKDSSQFTLNRAKQQIATDVTQAYYQVILDRQLLAIARWNADASSARADLLNEERRVGTASIPDAALQQARADLDRSSVITSEVKLHDDLLLLIQKLRVDPKETYDLEEPVLTFNDANEKIGDINDVILDKSGKVENVVLGVGGFLGMGEHYVAVAYDKLKWSNEPPRSTTASTTTSTTDRPATNADSAARTAANGPARTTGAATTTTGGSEGQRILVSRPRHLQCDQGPVEGDAAVQILKPNPAASVNAYRGGSPTEANMAFEIEQPVDPDRARTSPTKPRLLGVLGPRTDYRGVR